MKTVSQAPEPENLPSVELHPSAHADRWGTFRQLLGLPLPAPPPSRAALIAAWVFLGTS